MGVADLLAKTTLSVEQDKYVRIFRRAGDNLLNLINDILDLSKVEASQLEIERTGFSLSGLLEKVMEMVALPAHEKGLLVVCDVAPNVPTDVVGDPTRLRQVLLNLIGNAIKFTESGEVSLRVTRDQQSPTMLRFTVSDTGIGIPAEKLGMVFERFTQADSSTTRRFGGSGLGLTISKQLVEAMGGRIWVESTVAKGSVFALSLPFEVATASREIVLPIGTEPTLPLPPLQILLVEDSPDNCTIAVAYLQDTPYQLEIAETGAVACEMFIVGHYDLVLMDRQMPVMDGLTATRKIRAWELVNGRQPTPIIALTASALKGDREMCLAAGCTGFLTKPIKQEVLLQAISDRSKVSHQRSTTAARVELTLPHLAERVPLFLQRRRQDVATMLDALTRGEFTIVGRLGHDMKGAGASFGFQAITDIGASIEHGAASLDTEASRKSVGDLATFLDGAQGDRAFVATRLLRIVLVEDNDDLRMIVREVLEQDGHHVDEARDGDEGVARILAERPDIAIIDLGLPGIDGYEVARRVRAALGDAVALIAMTGRSSASDQHDALTAGFDTHMTKPIRRAALQQMLETMGRSRLADA
jgi:CheY-like chemotaxis protein